MVLFFLVDLQSKVAKWLRLAPLDSDKQPSILMMALPHFLALFHPCNSVPSVLRLCLSAIRFWPCSCSEGNTDTQLSMIDDQPPNICGTVDSGIEWVTMNVLHRCLLLPFHHEQDYYNLNVSESQKNFAGDISNLEGICWRLPSIAAILLNLH